MKKIIATMAFLMSFSIQALTLDCFNTVYVNGVAMPDYISEVTVLVHPNYPYGSVWNVPDGRYLGLSPVVYYRDGTVDRMDSYTIEMIIGPSIHRGFCTDPDSMLTKM